QRARLLPQPHYPRIHFGAYRREVRLHDGQYAVLCLVGLGLGGQAVPGGARRRQHLQSGPLGPLAYGRLAVVLYHDAFATALAAATTLLRSGSDMRLSSPRISVSSAMSVGLFGGGGALLARAMRVSSSCIFVRAASRAFAACCAADSTVLRACSCRAATVLVS